MYLKRLFTSADRITIQKQLAELSPNNKLSDYPVCDFCGDDSPVVMYAADRMSTGAEDVVWRWLACYTCMETVDEGRLEEVELKLADFVHEKLPLLSKSLALIAARQAFREFRRHAVKA